jgi:NAD(P)-dependent dehydrogenase (short-subunit alcohol dehydrogenase family)
MMKTFLVTGANRGLGLEFTRQLLRRGEKVLATARMPGKAKALKELKKKHKNLLEVYPLDISDDAGIDKLAEELHFTSLDAIINNAGILLEDLSRDNGIDPNTILKTLNVNTVGPMRVVGALLPMLLAGDNPIIANISSGLGSIGRAEGMTAPAYRISKAALNMATKTLAESLKHRRVPVISLDPGWVATDMGGPTAPLTPEESVDGMLKVIDGLSCHDTGRFINRHGEDVPW